MTPDNRNSAATGSDGMLISVAEGNLNEGALNSRVRGKKISSAVSSKGIAVSSPSELSESEVGEERCRGGTGAGECSGENSGDCNRRSSRRCSRALSTSGGAKEAEKELRTTLGSTQEHSTVPLSRKNTSRAWSPSEKIVSPGRKLRGRILFKRAVRRDGSALFRMGMFLIIEALECPTMSFPWGEGEGGKKDDDVGRGGRCTTQVLTQVLG